MVFSTLNALALRNERLNFYKNGNIYFEEFSVEMRDGAKIHGIMYVPDNFKSLNNGSIPTVLQLNGINSKKEDKFWVTKILLDLGYAVCVVEQRGHGESQGPSGFLEKEPDDMSELLTFIEENYQFVNTTHFGILGYSYGGGIGAILQAKDERIYTSVLFHPLSSIESVSNRLPFQNLIGSTPTISDLLEIKDAFYFANRTNTKNLLLIHGLMDTLILPEDSEDFYQIIDGPNRTDIQLELRPNLNHLSNEGDLISFKHAIVWLEHFYHNDSYNINNRESEFSSLNIKFYNFPENSTSDWLLISGIILLFSALSLFIIIFKILPEWNKLPYSYEEKSSTYGLKYKRMFLYRTIVYILPIFIIGPIFMILNRSFIYSYFIAYPLICMPLLALIPSELHRNWKSEWKYLFKRNSKPIIYSVIVIGGSILIFLLIFNLNHMISFEPIIPIINTSIISYLIVGFGSITMDSLYLREMKSEHIYVLLSLRPISILFFMIFIPLKPFPYLGGLISHIFFFILTGLILFYIRQLAAILSKFFKNNTSMIFLIMSPLIIFFTWVFFRIV